MQINIKATNLELTDAIRQYVESKVRSLESKIAGNPEVVAHVEVGKTTNHHKQGDVFRAEIDIVVSGKAQQFRATAELADLYAAIDKARDEVEREIVHFKEKKQTVYKRSARTLKNLLKRFWM